MNVADKINNLAKKTSQDVNMLRVAFSLERMVARISTHPTLSKKLIIKGGFLLFKTISSDRFTRDLDALGKNTDSTLLKNEVPKLIEKDLNDGIIFKYSRTEDLKHKEGYEGVRFIFQFGMGNGAIAIKRNSSKVQLDIGFGDKISTDLISINIPPLIDGFDEISCFVYPLEFVLSEKLHAIISNPVSSRAKDIHDINLLLPHCDLAKVTLAIISTFEQRGFPLPKSLVDEVKGRDKEILKTAWDKIVVTKKTTFDVAWGQFLSSLKKIELSNNHS